MAHQTHRKHRSHIPNEVPCDKGQAMTYTQHPCILLDVSVPFSGYPDKFKRPFRAWNLALARRRGFFGIATGTLASGWRCIVLLRRSSRGWHNQPTLVSSGINCCNQNTEAWFLLYSSIKLVSLHSSPDSIQSHCVILAICLHFARVQRPPDSRACVLPSAPPLEPHQTHAGRC